MICMGFLKIDFQGFSEDSRFVRAWTVGVQDSRASRLKNLQSSGFAILGFRFGLQLRVAADEAHAFQSIEIFLNPLPNATKTV